MEVYVKTVCTFACQWQCKEWQAQLTVLSSGLYCVNSGLCVTKKCGNNSNSVTNPLMSVPLEPESSAICTMTHLTIISRHFEAVFPHSLSLGYQTSSSTGTVCLLGCMWRMKIGQSSSNIPTPHSPSIITLFNHPHNHLSQRFSLGTRGWSICFLGPCFHPQALLLSLYPLWTQSASAAAPLSHTNSITTVTKTHHAYPFSCL